MVSLPQDHLSPASAYRRRAPTSGYSLLPTLWCAAAGTVGAVVEATVCSAGFGGYNIVIVVLVSATYLTPKYSFASGLVLVPGGFFFGIMLFRLFVCWDFGVPHIYGTWCY
ncbi:transmembrane protein, putative [Medicago truncatula]|uniref:Transmembrane protein, putative n=1 Tax=Medicago truncatula TaxID=3880 RepID=A2Q1A2_MEDTR|nr:hypothetical protein MtrDRAFT_AC148396g3v2 [Medicago truncatula]AES63560.1 transmembrane protein, putative [Medicago truncatula]